MRMRMRMKFSWRSPVVQLQWLSLSPCTSLFCVWTPSEVEAGPTLSQHVSSCSCHVSQWSESNANTVNHKTQCHTQWSHTNPNTESYTTQCHTMGPVFPVCLSTEQVPHSGFTVTFDLEPAGVGNCQTAFYPESLDIIYLSAFTFYLQRVFLFVLLWFKASVHFFDRLN